MKVVLMQRIGRLGQMGDVVNVKDGFARNFLLPGNKALRATMMLQCHIADDRFTDAAGLPQPLARLVAALPEGSRDAALLLTLDPGLYTAHATGVGRAAGQSLVEFYEVP